MMKLAVKYSLPAAELVRWDQIDVDLFRCHPRPALIRAARELLPVCLHFPLLVGAGTGDATVAHTGEPADWAMIETLLHQTNTPYLNLHLDPAAGGLSLSPSGKVNGGRDEMLLKRVIRDVAAVTQRFGADRVIVENPAGHQPRPVLEPEFIRRVIHETGSSLLLAPSNARLAADRLGMDVYDYIAALPTAYTREIETVGVQRFDGRWVDLFRQARFGKATIQPMLGKLIGHLPMIDEDWELITWVTEYIHFEAWEEPWAVAFTYGGVAQDHPDELLSDPEVLEEQVPRLRKLVTKEPIPIASMV